MAADWTVTNQRQTTANTPGLGLSDVVQVSFKTTSGRTGSVNVDLNTYKDSAKVARLIQERVDQIAAIDKL